MKKLLIAMGGITLLSVGYWLISPLFITRRVSERMEDIAPAQSPTASTIVKQGTFTGLAGHSGQGTAKLLKIGERHYVRLEDDFRVTNGPDLFVYFGTDGRYVAEARLAALKGNEGGQNYEVPADVNPLDYTEVWVWCRAFSVPFAKAELR